MSGAGAGQLHKLETELMKLQQEIEELNSDLGAHSSGFRLGTKGSDSGKRQTVNLLLAKKTIVQKKIDDRRNRTPHCTTRFHANMFVDPLGKLLHRVPFIQLSRSHYILL